MSSSDIVVKASTDILIGRTLDQPTPKKFDPRKKILNPCKTENDAGEKCLTHETFLSHVKKLTHTKTFSTLQPT